MSESDVYDLVGVGFGPANLALAIALREAQQSLASDIRFCFVEKQDGFAWHPALLLPGAQLQVSPLKDLVTMRDPTSSYSFTNYLHSRGRLASYINRESTVPSRREWSAYLDWAAKRMSPYVSYCQDVVSVEPVTDDDDASKDSKPKLLRITTRDLKTGSTSQILSKNITVGVGGIPQIPRMFGEMYREAFATSGHGQLPAAHLVHSSTYLPSLAKIEPSLRNRESRRLADANQASIAASTFSPAVSQNEKNPAPLRFAVIGGGQSSAEMCLHLRKTFPTAHVSMIFRATAIVQSDDSPFVNAMAFDPERTDAFWQASESDRLEWLNEFRRTNYSVVRHDVLNELHTALYDQSIDYEGQFPHSDGLPSHGQVRIVPNTRVEKAEYVNSPDDHESTSIALTLAECRTADGPHPRVETYDAVFLGTGFARSPSVMSFLKPLQHLYPRLDERAAERKAQLGFGDEADTPENVVKIMAYEGGDDVAVDRMRERTRGISRDYRLVSYTSDAFTAPRHRREGRLDAIAKDRGNQARNGSPRQHLAAHRFGLDSSLAPSEEARAQSTSSSAAVSGASSPRRESETSLSSGGSSSTLAEDGVSHNAKLDPLYGTDSSPLASAIARSASSTEASIYFLGGNEATHGLSDSLLSIVAHRAGELSSSLVERLRFMSGQLPARSPQRANVALTEPVKGIDKDSAAISNKFQVPAMDQLEVKLRGMRSA